VRPACVLPGSRRQKTTGVRKPNRELGKPKPGLPSATDDATLAKQPETCVRSLPRYTEPLNLGVAWERYPPRLALPGACFFRGIPGPIPRILFLRKPSLWSAVYSPSS
jgi:hypothetical protein